MARNEEMTPNPSIEPMKFTEDFERIPMSVPQRKLEVPFEIPGYHLYWMRGTPERIQQAIRGGYEFVDQNEVQLNNNDLGGDAAAGGNTDMGSRVSYVAGQGDVDVTGQPVRLYLMKIRNEWYEEDRKIIAQRNDRTTEQIRSGLVGAGSSQTGETSEDVGHRYTKQVGRGLFASRNRNSR